MKVEIFRGNKCDLLKKKCSQSCSSSWLWSLPVLMGLGWCPVLFSWLGELVSVFWWMELDLISLKSSSVSNSKFSGVCGFNVSLGSPSGFGSVRHLFLQPLQSGPLSISSQSPAPQLSLGSLLVLLPCTAGWSLLGRVLGGPFLSSPTVPAAWGGLCAFVLSHRPASFVVGLVCSPLDAPSWPFALQGLCVLARFICLLTLGSRACHLVGATVCELLTGWEVEVSPFSAP